MLRHVAALIPLLAFALFLGMAIYHWVEGLGWSDSFLNASMLLGGMGPVGEIHRPVGKIFASLYALYAGIVFIGAAVLLLSPVVHRILHKLRLEEKRAQK